MLLRVCAVRDAKTEVFSHPMFFVTKGVAIRSFFDEAARAGSDIAKHSEDFALFDLGVYDDNTGQFTGNEQPVMMCSAMDAVQKGLI